MGFPSLQLEDVRSHIRSGWAGSVPLHVAPSTSSRSCVPSGWARLALCLHVQLPSECWEPHVEVHSQLGLMVHNSPLRAAPGTPAGSHTPSGQAGSGPALGAPGKAAGSYVPLGWARPGWLHASMRGSQHCRWEPRTIRLGPLECGEPHMETHSWPGLMACNSLWFLVL